jgi:hypothetical protein
MNVKTLLKFILLLIYISTELILLLLYISNVNINQKYILFYFIFKNPDIYCLAEFSVTGLGI